MRKRVSNPPTGPSSFRQQPPTTTRPPQSHVTTPPAAPPPFTQHSTTYSPRIHLFSNPPNGPLIIPTSRSSKGARSSLLFQTRQWAPHHSDGTYVPPSN